MAKLIATFVCALAFAFAMPAYGEGQAPIAPIVRYATVLRSFNPQLSLAQSRDIASHVLLLSSYYSLDPRLLVAIVGVESSWHTHAVSPVGAQGLGQLMPATAGLLGVLAFDTYENLDGTARYLRRMMRQYANLSPEARTTRAIASYNAGPGAVARAGGVPAIPETQAYVVHVLGLWHKLETELPGNVAIPATTEHVAALPHPVVVARIAPPAFPAGSVADFTQLEVRSMEALAASMPATVTTPSAPEKRGLRRWFSRAFGPH